MERKTIYNGKMVDAIDCTPTWEGVLPLYLDAIRNGNENGYSAAVEELTHMAQLADKYNQSLKYKAK